MNAVAITKLLICEDDPRVRQTLSRVAGSQADLEVVAAVDNGEDAIDVATDPGVDVIVLDLHLPTIDGIEVIRRAPRAAACHRRWSCSPPTIVVRAAWSDSITCRS